MQTHTASGQKHFVLSKELPDPMTRQFRESVRQAIQKQQEAGHPIAVYDPELHKPYLLYPDGRRVYRD